MGLPKFQLRVLIVVPIEFMIAYVRVFLHAIIKVQSKSPLLSAPILLGEKVMALSYIWLIKAQ